MHGLNMQYVHIGCKRGSMYKVTFVNTSSQYYSLKTSQARIEVEYTVFTLEVIEVVVCMAISSTQSYFY